MKTIFIVLGFFLISLNSFADVSVPESAGDEGCVKKLILARMANFAISGTSVKSLTPDNINVIRNGYTYVALDSSNTPFTGHIITYINHTSINGKPMIQCDLAWAQSERFTCYDSKGVQQCIIPRSNYIPVGDFEIPLQSDY